MRNMHVLLALAMLFAPAAVLGYHGGSYLYSPTAVEQPFTVPDTASFDSNGTTAPSAASRTSVRRRYREEPSGGGEGDRGGNMERQVEAIKQHAKRTGPSPNENAYRRASQRARFLRREEGVTDQSDARTGVRSMRGELRGREGGMEGANGFGGSFSERMQDRMGSFRNRAKGRMDVFEERTQNRMGSFGGRTQSRMQNRMGEGESGRMDERFKLRIKGRFGEEGGGNERGETRFKVRGEGMFPGRGFGVQKGGFPGRGRGVQGGFPGGGGFDGGFGGEGSPSESKYQSPGGESMMRNMGDGGMGVTYPNGGYEQRTIRPVKGSKTPMDMPQYPSSVMDSMQLQGSYIRVRNTFEGRRTMLGSRVSPRLRRR